MFGVPLYEQQYTRAGVPLVICKCIEFIEDNGMEDVGLYRVSGRSKQIDDLTLQFDQDCRSLVINPEVFTVHDVTGVFKRFLRALPQSLLTTELHSKFISTVGLEHNDKMYAIFELMRKLPKENKNSLLAICQHLNKVCQLESQNKMGVGNLALVFGPNIRGADQSSGPVSETFLLTETQNEVTFLKYNTVETVFFLSNCLHSQSDKDIRWTTKNDFDCTTKPFVFFLHRVFLPMYLFLMLKKFQFSTIFNRVLLTIISMKELVINPVLLYILILALSWISNYVLTIQFLPKILPTLGKPNASPDRTLRVVV